MQKGILKSWNDAKGFGFIQLENGGEDIFIHISSLQASERRPIVKDIIYFNVAVDENGQKRAVNASIEGVKSVFSEWTIRNNESKIIPKTNPSRPRSQAANNNPVFTKFFRIIMLLAVVFSVYKIYEKNRLVKAPSFSPNPIGLEEDSLDLPNNEQFRCEGKTRCGQMTSCDEAIYYLNNCPGTLMDGDDDDLPCEDQWCGH